ncbi:MAG: cell division topological specificity factor MinE [Nitrosomonas sp.]|jgi:cell division topological specificity factor|nr:cell division topological specificity factor MinE [Nitrosomonas sp.]
MSLLDYFRASKPKTASLAKERLQILVAHERNFRNKPSYLPQLQRELLDVIRKYVHVEQDAISVNFEQDDDQEVLELNIILPEHHEAKRTLNM